MSSLVRTAACGSGSERAVVVHISDTHGRHRELTGELVPGDVLVHSGDFLVRQDGADERLAVAADFNAWLGEMRAACGYSDVVVVCGNHDLVGTSSPTAIAALLPNATVVHDQVVVLECGATMFGSPWTGAGATHAFGTTRQVRAAAWSLIPPDVDVVVTHMPPRTVLDLAYSKPKTKKAWACDECGDTHPPTRKHWGDAALRDTVLDRVRPALHLFGHVHDEPGSVLLRSTLFVNSSYDLDPLVHVIELAYDPARSAEVVELYRGDAALFAARPAAPGGWVNFVHVASGRVLDVDNAVAAEGTPIILWKKRRARPNQMWRIEADGRIVSALAPTLCLGRASGSATPILCATDASDRYVVWTHSLSTLSLRAGSHTLCLADASDDAPVNLALVRAARE